MDLNLPVLTAYGPSTFAEGALGPLGLARRYDQEKCGEYRTKRIAMEMLENTERVQGAVPQ